MMDWDSDEGRSYISLCRHLRLERAINVGDYFMHDFDKRPALWCNADHGPGKNAIWLPRLDQWLAMLEESDCRYFRFYDGSRVKGHSPGWHASCLIHDGGSTCVHDAVAPTREEAAGRLWAKVQRP